MPEEIVFPEIPINEINKEESDFIDSLFNVEPEIILEPEIFWQIPLFHTPY